MALLFFTGFEGDPTYDWDASSILSRGTGGARSGDAYGNFYDWSGWAYKDLPSTANTIIVGVAWYEDATTLRSHYIDFYSEGNVQVRIDAQTNDVGSAYVKAYRGTSNLLGTGTISTYFGSWFYIEAKVYIHDSAGTVVTKLDETQDLNLSSQDTKAYASTDQIDRILIGNSAKSHVDDFYICDTTGSVNNDFLGAVKVEAIRPSGNGYNSDFVGSDADSVDNYLHVDDVTSDGDTSYVKSGTISDIDSFAYGNLTGSINSIKGIRATTVAKKSETYIRGFKNFVRVSSTNYLGSESNPSTGYLGFSELWEENPNTATGWTESDVNAIEAGITITA